MVAAYKRNFYYKSGVETWNSDGGGGDDAFFTISGDFINSLFMTTNIAATCRPYYFPQFLSLRHRIKEL